MRMVDTLEVAEDIIRPFLRKGPSGCGDCDSKLIGCFGSCATSRYRAMVAYHGFLAYEYMLAKSLGKDGKKELAELATNLEKKKDNFTTIRLGIITERAQRWVRNNLDSEAADQDLYVVDSPETLSVASEVSVLKEEPMTTTEYRRWREEIGLPLQHDQHVGHIIAKSNGGADHQDNYYPVSAWINVSVGNRDDSFLAVVAGLEATRKAVAVSKRLRKYNGPSAEELVEMGKQRHKSWQS